MNSKTKVGAIVVAFGIALGAYWYMSPYLAMRSVHAAALAKDADAFNDHVDYPKVRESIKGQMAAMMADKLGTSSGGGAESLGAAFGMAMLGPMVDAFVRPEMVMKSMQDGKIQPKLGGPKSAENSNTSDTVKWDIQRKGLNKVIAYGQAPGDTSSKPGFVFERVGFAGWKLTEVRLPDIK